MLPRLVTPVPGPRSKSLAQELRRHECRNTTFVDDDFPIFWERAEGTNVWDVDGNRFLDLTSAFGVAGIGHTHPEVVAAVRSQGERLLHGMGDVHPAELKVQLCARLSALTYERWGLGPAKVLLGNSGFEAVEAALKTAFVHTGRPGVITFENAYHGLGYGALAAGSFPRFRDPFAGQLAPIGTILPFADTGTADDNLATVTALVRREIEQGGIGAVLIEPVQGRGGKNIAHPGFLRELRTICDQSGVLLIFDEVLTGFNRTGALFACEPSQVYPDIVCLGKALTSGYPLSAAVAPAAIMDAWPESTGEALHTTTFIGNPLGCAMALASLGVHARESTGEKVRASGEKFRARLAALDSPHIDGVRGLGLMLGLALRDHEGVTGARLAQAIVTQGLKDGLILLAESPEGNILSLVPPFDISEEEMAWTGERLQEYFVSLPGSIS